MEMIYRLAIKSDVDLPVNASTPFICCIVRKNESVDLTVSSRAMGIP